MTLSIEEQLAEYRARRRKEAYIAAAKRKIISMISLNISQGDDEPLIEEPLAITENNPETLKDDIDFEDISLVNIIRRNKFKTICFTFWMVVFMTFVHFQWGAVFFVVSALFFIYMNTRTRSRKSGEVSAYSVFNKNCKSIDGTLTAEQFENELRYGLGTVR